MKIFVTSNTHFGYKKISDKQFSYFYEYLIPFLKEKSKENDLFIHMGNVFSNRKNVSMDIINKTMNVFEEISEILPVYLMKSKNDQFSIELLKRIKNVNVIEKIKNIDNITILPITNKIEDDLKNISNDILLFNYDYTINPETIKNVIKNKFEISICGYFDDIETNDDNIINVHSPYDLNKNHENKKGLIIIDTDRKKFKFVENTYSPKFINIYIKELDDSKILENHKNDFVELKISKSIVKTKENRNKLDIILNKYEFDTITYVDDKMIKEEDIKIDDHTFNIREIIESHLKDKNELLKELDIVYKIYDGKKDYE
jgi:hypothetical protein